MQWKSICDLIEVLLIECLLECLLTHSLLITVHWFGSFHAKNTFSLPIWLLIYLLLNGKGFWGWCESISQKKMLPFPDIGLHYNGQTLSIRQISSKNGFSAFYSGVVNGGASGIMVPHFNFQTKQGPKVSLSNIRDIAFYQCSEMMRTRNFTFFTVYVTIFGQFMAAFHFFELQRGNRWLFVGPDEKVQYLTLDLLKSFFLRTIGKKATMNESLNLRL